MKKRILFVCLGNICRSPMAEAVFRFQVEKAGLSDKIHCDSAGTAGYHIGAAPDKRTLQVLEDNGLYTQHKGRRLSSHDFSDFDYIIVMDHSNYQDVMQVMSRSSKTIPVQLFREFESENLSGKVEEVPDPYYGSMKDFRHVYDLCLQSSLGLLEYLKKKYAL